MSRTRDTIKEIAKVRERQQFGDGMTELLSNLLKLQSTFSGYDRSQPELMRYFPVALVACIESYFRIVVKELVDAGDPFLSNAEKTIAASIKPNFSMIRAIHEKSVTVGKLVAHSLKLSRLEHIETNLSALLGISFLTQIRTTADRWAHEVEGQPLQAILQSPDDVYADVSRTFELRHIICHEIASAYVFDASEIDRLFESCVLFLKASENYILQVVYPDAPLTQMAMNADARQRLTDSEERLAAVIRELSNQVDPEWFQEFKDVNTLWKQYCASWVTLRIGKRGPTSGSMWPMLHAGIKQDLTDIWIADLEKFRDRKEGQF